MSNIFIPDCLKTDKPDHSKCPENCPYGAWSPKYAQSTCGAQHLNDDLTECGGSYLMWRIDRTSKKVYFQCDACKDIIQDTAL